MKTDINVKPIVEILTNPIKYFLTFFINVVIVLQIVYFFHVILGSEILN